MAQWPLRLFALATARLMRLMAERGLAADVYLRRGVLPVPLHYYQPVFDAGSVPAAVWERKHELPGVDFDPDAQLEFLQSISRFSSECVWPEQARQGDRTRYYSQNASFGFSSACLLHTVVRHFGPSRIIEVGAGMSTLVLLGALSENAAKSGRQGKLTSIDPYPTEAVADVRSANHRLISSEVQQTPLTEFAELGVGDLLFIDSSHVLRTGGDVSFLYLDVLPRLASGVVVHIHDIQLPYEYPRAYAAGTGSAPLYWTEQYLLQSFLSYNREFKVLLAGHYLQRDHAGRFAELFPSWQPSIHRPTSSFYMQRV